MAPDGRIDAVFGRPITEAPPTLAPVVEAA
jgi:hypothetical protein